MVSLAGVTEEVRRHFEVTGPQQAKDVDGQQDTVDNDQVPFTDADAPDQVKSCTEVEEVDVKWINTQAGKSCTKDYCHAACPFKNVV